MKASPNEIPAAPYVGLRPFEFDEATLFYGRGEHVAEMVRTLRKRHFLAVIGSSGSGKSSLVRAGLLPAIKAGFMSSGEDDLDWRFVIMRPGRDPYENLLAALLPELTAGQALDEQVVEFRRQTVRGGPRGLVEAVTDALLPETVRLVVLVDQFEEVFRFLERGGPIQPSDGGSVAERRNAALAFVDMLLAIAEERDPRVYVVLTMRSEYLGDCEAFLGLSAAIAKAQFLTPRLTREQVQDVIERPLVAVGGRLEPQVVTALLNSLGTAQDQLPRVEHALLRMWDRACIIHSQQPDPTQPITFTMGDYEAVGRFETALDLHGEQLFWALGPETETGQPPTETQRVAERMFRALAVHTSQGTLVRRLSSIGEVASIAGVSEKVVADVVEHFRQPGCNFVVATPLDQPLTGNTTLDISHESLLRQWKRMGEWAAAEERSARRYQRLLQTANLEKEGNAGLWYDPELQINLDWLKEEAPTAPWAALYGAEFATATAFLEKSRLERDTKSAAAILDRRWKMTWRFAVIAICAAVAYAIYCSAVPEMMLRPLRSFNEGKSADANSAIAPLKELQAELPVVPGKRVEAVGTKILSRVEERKDKAKVFADALATLVILGPALALFFILDYAGKRAFRRVVFPKILKEVADSTDKTLREEKLKKELARKAITDAAAALHTTYARFWRRVGAYVLDTSSFLLATSMLIVGIFNVPVLRHWFDSASYSSFIFLLPFLCDWLCTVLMLSSQRQATLGMKAMGIFVTDQHADRLHFGNATAWYFATLLSYLTLGIGFLIQIWMKRHQTLPDFVTRNVVLSRPDRKKVPWWMVLLCCVLSVPLLFVGFVILVIIVEIVI
ncbi:MAG: RDD family protein [Chthoniobacteraceae bacterium]